jgi:radical SAM enzyme (TIGR01210 family)
MSATLPAIYPEKSSERDRWILDRRPQRNQLDATRPYAFFVEEECSASGEVVSVATILLTNRECPWRCLVCDLWKNTLSETVPVGAIPVQIEFALQQLPTARQVKLYNSGSFFDRRAIPWEDHPQIAQLVKSFERVVVESHPALVSEDCFRFNDLVEGSLEVAMGLETANPQVLAKLNKRMTLEQFAAASERLRSHDIALRVFILVKPPFMQEDQALEWACKSLDFAFDCGATAATLIPTRAGNGAIDRLAQNGYFFPPNLFTLEAAIKYGLVQRRGRVFADLWDFGQMTTCPQCFQDRIERLRGMNLQQRIAPPILCNACGGTVAE